jgi:hypothetical protein
VAEWLKNGVPVGRDRKPRPADAVMALDGILKAVRKADLNGDDALRIVEALRGLGLIDVSAAKSGASSGLFVEFLKAFWDYDTSPYVREKLAYGHSLGKRHCYECLNRIRQHYAPVFAGQPLTGITRQDLKTFYLSLKAKGYSAGNNTRDAFRGL